MMENVPLKKGNAKSEKNYNIGLRTLMKKIQSKVALNVLKDKLKKLDLTFDRDTKRDYEKLEKKVG